MRHLIHTLLQTLLLIAGWDTVIGQEVKDEEFVEWAGQALVAITSGGIEASTDDLDPLSTMIGDARIVALSDAVVIAAQPLNFRNRLFKYLVEELGFTTIAVESGVVEGRVADDYVSGGSETLEVALSQGLSWTTDRFPQNEELLRWMREYNQKASPDSRLKFYGYDIPGSPANARVERGVGTALEVALGFLEQVDPEAAAQFQDRLRPVRGFLYFDPIGVTTPPDGVQYTGASMLERDTLTAIVSDLISMLERRWTIYSEQEEEYEWGLRAAIGARQMDDFLRHIPFDWVLEDGDVWFQEALLERSRAMASNMEWILNRLNSSERVLVFGAVTHLAAQPIRRAEFERLHISFGTYLKRQYRDDVFTIGNLINGGEVRNCVAMSEPRQLPSPPRPIRVNQVFAAIGNGPYLLDLRDAPARFDDLLGTTQNVWQNDAPFALTMNAAFHIVYFSGRVTPACG